MLAEDADVWILTEANDAVYLPGYNAITTSPVSGYHAAGEVSTALLTRWPISQSLPTWDPLCAVCAEIAAPIGPVLVYGTIVTYANDKGPSNTAKRWEEHRRSIDRHRLDWLKLKSRAGADGHVVVAGDFNQSLDGSGWYKDSTSMGLLSDALAASALRCVTEEDFRKTVGLSRASIDHICLSQRLASKVRDVRVWEGVVAGVRASDHNGVLVELDA
jgi:exonuclease III